MMTEIEAYPCGRDYETRSGAEYSVGERVVVGPAYRGGNNYAPDNCSGEFYITRDLSDGDYEISRNLGGDYDFIVHVSRITSTLRAEVPASIAYSKGAPWS